MVCIANDNEQLLTTQQELDSFVRAEIARNVAAFQTVKQINDQVGSVMPSLNRTLESIARFVVASNG